MAILVKTFGVRSMDDYWEFTETNKEYAIRLIREGKSEEAIKVLEESE
jgi:hypothetical protein